MAGQATMLERMDIAAGHAVARHHGHPVVAAAAAVGELADQPPLIALSIGTAAVGFVRRDERLLRTGVRMLASHLLATGMKAVLKANIDRARPILFATEHDHRLTEGRENDGPRNSFPSGHTAGALAVARAVAREYPGAAGPGYAASAGVAAIQLPQGAHFPLDVAVGAVIGLTAEWLTAQVLPAAEPQVPRAAIADAAVAALTPP